jgi:polar amino acid transport system substrate-binding protein
MPVAHCYRMLVVLLVFCSLAASAQQKQEVLLLTYHLKAPYVVNLGEQKGLYFDLAGYLNRHSEHYRFKTEFMPRKRIDAMLQRPFAHVVVGVQPSWFKAFADSVSFSVPILQESDVFVSLTSNALTNAELTNLTGKTFIGVQGYRYTGLEAAEKSGSLSRVDTLQEDNVLDMLRLGRGDFTVMSQSTLHYKFSHGEQAERFYVAEQPHEQVLRRLMYSSTESQLGAEINALLSQMRQDPTWLTILQSYGLDQSFVPAI